MRRKTTRHHPLLLTALGTAGAYLIANAATRPWYRRWGATDDEVAARVPGDEHSGYITSTRAVTIDAPVEEVWRWLVQVGQDRAGFYSYTWLENAALAGMHNAEEIHPEWQELKAGDMVRLGSEKVYGDSTLLRVAAIEPNHYIVLERWGTFLVEPAGDGKTRLLIRSHGEAPGRLWRLVHAFVTEPAHFIMERKMMLGIKERAERSATSRSPAEPPSEDARPLASSY